MACACGAARDAAADRLRSGHRVRRRRRARDAGRRRRRTPACCGSSAARRCGRAADGARMRARAATGTRAASMKGVAARYPAWDAAAGRIVDLEDRINACRVERQRAPPLRARIGGPARADDARRDAIARPADRRRRRRSGARGVRARARTFYYERHGQMNLAVRELPRAERGQAPAARRRSARATANACPAYRLEWQALGSLQRRLRACLFGIRAEMPPEGAPELTELELYLAWRAQRAAARDAGRPALAPSWCHSQAQGSPASHR